METELTQLRKALAESERRVAKQAAKIVRLEKEDAQYRRPRRSTRNLTPFRFLDLPAEMREMIYSICVSVGKVFPHPRTLYDTRYQNLDTYRKPEWQLLSVNRQIRIEAAKVLCMKNQIVISNEHESWSMFLQDRSSGPSPHLPCSIALSALMGRYLTSVSITLDIRGVADDPLELAGRVRRNCDDAFMDNKIEDCVGNDWTLKAHGLTDLGGCNCLGDAFFHPRLETIEILGALNPPEREQIIDVLTDCEEDGSLLPLMQHASPTVRFKAPTRRPELGLDMVDFGEELEDEDFILWVELRKRRDEKLRERAVDTLL